MALICVRHSMGTVALSFLLWCVQCIQKQLFKVFTVGIDSHANRSPILTQFCATTIRTFLFNNSQGFRFEGCKGIISEDGYGLAPFQTNAGLYSCIRDKPHRSAPLGHVPHSASRNN